MNIPIDRGSTYGHTVVPMIRLYNPSRIVSQNRGIYVPKYKFWNPLNPSDVLKAAYGYSDPWSRPSCFTPPVTGRCPLPGRTIPTDNLLRRYMDDMNRWVFGDDYVSPFSRYHDDSFNSIMDVGRSVLNNTWDMMEPFHKMWMYPRYPDHSNPDISVDLQNYRISRERGSFGKPRVCPLRDPLLYNSGTYSNPREQSDMNIIRKEDDRSYKLSFTIPNVNAKNIKIKIRDGLLTVSGHAERVKRGDHESEMRYSESFQHSVSLPRDAMELDAKARLRNDTLTIEIPKRH
eukprot:XP_001609330.1 hypothetical protein [Babesia bovis T2Bo]